MSGPAPRPDDGSATGPRIHVLPEDLANQIAAGEVVERPASVVKELLENALDAGARRVRVDVEGGGVVLTRVSDDGEGMRRDDASLAALRHATSKLRAFDDLRTIQSFGFRGEALPSIASVSHFSIRTRRKDDAEGTLVRIDGGGPPDVAPCASAPGTTIEVRDLFYNVPARRKFLKATATESARITEVVQAVALGEPGVTLILGREGRVVGEWLRAASREERVRAIFAGEELATCRGERGPASVEAFLSRPERARPGATSLMIFVNGRHVRDRTLARSVALAYGSVLEQGKYPVGAVYIDLPPELVDVNVHPQKTEVRFADGRAVGDAVYKIVAGAMAAAFGLPAPGGYRGRKQKPADEPETPGASSWVWSSGPSATPQASAPEAGPSDPWGIAGDPPAPASHPSLPFSPNPSPSPSPNPYSNPSPYPNPYSSPVPNPNPSPPLASNPAPSLPRSPVPYPTAADLASAARSDRHVPFAALRFVAQVRSTFLICEGPDGMYFLDQHAAAERVTFHRLRTAFDARDVKTQRLLFPVVVEVAPSELAFIEEAQDAIARAGVDVRAAGPNAAAVHAVPSLLARASPEALLRDLLGEISHGGERAYSGAIDRALATMACHGSLRAGDPVAPEEARALLGALDEADFAGHCPHGRPVVMRIGWNELEHRVGRR